jgi:hypothetical protein
MIWEAKSGQVLEIKQNHRPDPSLARPYSEVNPEENPPLHFEEGKDWIPSRKNLKTSEDFRCLQIMPSRYQPRCRASININFKLRSVFRFLQTEKSTEGSGGLSRLEFCLQMSPDAPI